MDKKSRRQRYYTFMVIPHDTNGKTISIKVPHLLIRAVIGLVVFAVLLVGSSFVYSAHLSRKLVNYSNAIAKNREQKAVINKFADKTEEVHQVISELVQEDNKLRKMLGMKNWKTKIKLSSKIEAQDPIEESEQIVEELKQVDIKLAERKKSYDELKSWVNAVRNRYASTPSRWPINGRIVSRYGYRVYPWRGFHTGIDISGRYGAPVRATADGVVKFVGWRSGYGKTVILDHGRGVATLYAHNSRYSVKVGQEIKKGQVICSIGNTGYTTGPHLHYEVRKAGRRVNPVSYLDLNILTASKIWRR